MKRFLLTLTFIASTALALGLAVPAQACSGDCDDCRHKSASAGDRKPTGTSAPTAPTAPTAAPGVTGDAKCHCEKGGKGCTCAPGKCDCENCGNGKKGA